MSKTKIEWATDVWNPITGCSPISEGCRSCYAQRMARRLGGRYGYPEYPNHFDVTFHPDRLDQPLKWRKPKRIFACSMGDLFHEDVFDLKSPFDFGFNYLLGSYIFYTDYPMLDAIFGVMERCPAHVFMLLTKRPGNMRRYFHAVQKHKLEYANKFKGCPTEAMRSSPAANDAWNQAINPIPENLWLGVSAENQKLYEERWIIASKIPATVKFVSLEPALEYIDIDIFAPWPDWVIWGAESGPGKRPFKNEWAESIFEQCQEKNIPFFDKRKNYLAREFPERASFEKSLTSPQ